MIVGVAVPTRISVHFDPCWKLFLCQCVDRNCVGCQGVPRGCYLFSFHTFNARKSEIISYRTTNVTLPCFSVSLSFIVCSFSRCTTIAGFIRDRCNYISCEAPISGRYITVFREVKSHVVLCEVRINGQKKGTRNGPIHKVSCLFSAVHT